MKYSESQSNFYLLSYTTAICAVFAPKQLRMASETASWFIFPFNNNHMASLLTENCSSWVAIILPRGLKIRLYGWKKYCKVHIRFSCAWALVKTSDLICICLIRLKFIWLYLKAPWSFGNWQPIINSFANITISITNLILKLVIQNNFYSETRLVKLI